MNMNNEILVRIKDVKNERGSVTDSKVEIICSQKGHKQS
jgi:hypothetical protein